MTAWRKPQSWKSCPRVSLPVDDIVDATFLPVAALRVNRRLSSKRQKCKQKLISDVFRVITRGHFGRHTAPPAIVVFKFSFFLVLFFFFSSVDYDCTTSVYGFVGIYMTSLMRCICCVGDAWRQHHHCTSKLINRATYVSTYKKRMKSSTK